MFLLELGAPFPCGSVYLWSWAYFPSTGRVALELGVFPCPRSCGFEAGRVSLPQVEYPSHWSRSFEAGRVSLPQVEYFALVEGVVITGPHILLVGHFIYHLPRACAAWGEGVVAEIDSFGVAIPCTVEKENSVLSAAISLQQRQKTTN